MAKMKMKMGAPALKANPYKDERHAMKKKYGMKMDIDGRKGMNQEDMKVLKDTMSMKKMDMNMPNNTMPKDKMKINQPTDTMKMDMPMNEMSDMNMYAAFNYDYLRSPNKTTYSPDIPVQEILLNLTGNMQRYIWSMNGVPISEADEIKIKGNQITRITLNNLTMMHHPMHLHGHFFRVINKHGEYSPLKHTVNVPPMQEVTLEFYGNEYGDWFFHCHVLYHMMGGMARVFSYGTPRDQRMTAYPTTELLSEMDQYYTWGMADVVSQMTAIKLVSSNLRNQFNLSATTGYNEKLEAEFTYERYLHDYLRIFGGINVENTTSNSLTSINVTAVAGLRYLTPYLFNLDLRIDNQLRPRIGIGRNIMIFPRFSVIGYYEYQADFGIINDLENENKYNDEIVWSAGAEYMLSKNFSLMGSYDNRFGAGGGLSVRF